MNHHPEDTAGGAITQLGIPAALMTLLHNDDGQPIQRYSPHRLTAAAELSDLVTAGRVRVEDDDVVHAEAPGPDLEGWRCEVLADLSRRTAGGRRVAVARWTARRREALSEHQQEAVRAGALDATRGKLLGLVGYDRYEPVPRVREAVLAELTAPGEVSPATAALAALVNAVGLADRFGLDAAATARLTAHGTDDLGEEVAAAIRCLRTTVLVSAVV